MNRRNFLLGSVAATAGGILISVEPKVLAVFAPTLAETIAISRPTPVTDDLGMPFETLYDKNGWPVAQVDGIARSVARFDISSAHDSFENYEPGMIRVDLKVHTLPGYFKRGQA